MTFSALLKLFIQRDPRIETLMVIGYNPSHSNINSEVNAPFKILSLLVRLLENEIYTYAGDAQFSHYIPFEVDSNLAMVSAFLTFLYTAHPGATHSSPSVDLLPFDALRI